MHMHLDTIIAQETKRTDSIYTMFQIRPLQVYCHTLITVKTMMVHMHLTQSLLTEHMFILLYGVLFKFTMYQMLTAQLFMHLLKQMQILIKLMFLEIIYFFQIGVQVEFK